MFVSVSFLIPPVEASTTQHVHPPPPSMRGSPVGNFLPTHPPPSQGVLLLLAFVSIPVLLLAKPLTIKSRMNKAAARQDSFSSESQLMGGDHTPSDKTDNGHAAGGEGGGGGGHEEHDFSEIAIHQVNMAKKGCVERT